jgi:phosphatidylglycerol:prolipoprotein diacylglycerol transferase
VVVSAIVGARIMHVLANLSYYTAQPGEIIAVWHGGLSSFGGLILGIPTGIIYARRRCPELPSVKALDILAPVLMASWGVGRLLGPQLMIGGGGHMTTQWFGMYYAGESGKRLPVPLFQAFDSFVIWGILLLIERKWRDRPTGFVLAATASLWGLGRFVEERFWLAGPSAGSSTGQHLVEAAGIALFVAGIGVMVWLELRNRRNLSKPPDPSDGPPAEASVSVDSAQLG